jgi:hypothetical protein
VQPKTLTILATYQCTAACRQCCFGCTYEKKGRIPQPRILNYIDQSAALGHIVNVVFSGGECFLLGRDLTEAVARAASHGLSTRCVTNGYWATSLAAARLRLGPLVDAGLKELNISTGDFHLEHVPVERVAAGAVAAYELGLGLSLMVETRQERSFSRDVLLKDPVLAEIHREDPEGLRIHENVWIPMDPDCTIAHDEVHHRNRTNPHFMKGCETVLRNMVITPDEEYVVCCGLTMSQIPELHIASAQAEPLRDIAARADHDLLLRWLRADGPEQIIEFLQRCEPSLGYGWDRVHPCQACRDIFVRPDFREAVRRHAPDAAAGVMFRFQLLDEAERAIREAGGDVEPMAMGDGVTYKRRLRVRPNGETGRAAAAPAPPSRERS